MISTKYKINSIIKDFELRSKDVAPLLEKCGLKDKSRMALLTPDEFDVLINAITSNAMVKDIGAYLAGETKVVVEHPAPKVATPKETPAEPAEPEQPKEIPSQPLAAQGEQKSGAGESTPPSPPRAVADDRQSQQSRFKNPLEREDKAKKKPEPKKKERPQSGITFQFDGRAQADSASTGEVVAEESARIGKTRVIETRGDTADRSQYDEALERFVDPETTGFGSEVQKIVRTSKRPVSGGGGGKGSRPAAARSTGGQRGGQRQGSGRAKSSQRAGGGTRGKRGREADKMRRRREMERKQKPLEVSIPDEISVGELASRLKMTAAVVVKRLISLGVMASVSDVIDYDTAYLVADELGAKVTREVRVSLEEKLFPDEEDPEESLLPRAPVVCVMGHVDHGKTSLLDYIRHTHVTAGEAGGITQAIGAYRVRVQDRDITFLDTPGHEAFTAMRARGAMSTDIAILVVAADDGIMPQTIEAIHHAKAAGVDIVVAINKMDKPGANAEQVKQELTKYDLVPEDWGGDTICVPVSAVTGQGIDDLLENVLLVAEMKQLRANPARAARGVVLEAKLDRGRGPVATVLVQNGTLRPGDIVLAGSAVGRVRAMTDENRRALKEAGPSVPVEITGLSDVPAAGDHFGALPPEKEKEARDLAEERRARSREETFKARAKVRLGDLFAQIEEGAKELNIIVKADVDGSAEAVKQSLEKIENDEVKVKVIHAAAGGITESDILLASTSNAIIVGFNIRPDKAASDAAERAGVEIRTYRVIYECIEEIEQAMKGMLAPTYRENLLGHIEVRETIHVPNVGTIAGSYVQDGHITRRAQIRVLRDSRVIFEDRVASLRRFKDDVREVAAGYECGIGLERFGDIKVGDILEAYEMVEVER